LFITALKSLGCPEIICCVQGLAAAKGKSRATVLKELESYFQSVFAREVRVLDAEDSVIIARSLSTMATREVGWRYNRTYLTADTVQVLPSSDTDGSFDNSQTCTVRLSGFLRGLPLSLHSLGHIPGVGPCRVAAVEVSSPEGPLRPHRAISSSAVVLTADPSRQESLDMFSSSDVLMGEQTWPTEAELGTAEGSLTDGRNRRNLPKNVSHFNCFFHFPLIQLLLTGIV